MSDPKPTPILPPGQAEERPLFVIMVIMAFLATLTLTVVLMGLRQSASWQSDLKSAATVQIMTDEAGQVDEALKLLRAFPGVKSADPLSAGENRALLSPWIGELSLPEDIKIPSLIKIQADLDTLDEDALIGAFESAGIKAEFDNHRQWSRNLATTWARMRLALLSLLVLIIGATVAISSFATRSVLRSRQNIINVLGQVGASDKFIAGLFVKRFMSLGFKAAISGMVLAVAFISLFVLWQNLGTDENGYKLALKIGDIFWLIVLAAAIGAISAFTAGRSALGTIRRQRPG
ncbi:MAG: hypothetical protein HKN36_02620 [Hellea sp.]|nr:hypothetical protein [Hellea sp.]